MALILFGIKEYWRMNIGGFAGSYPFVETYEFNVSENELLEIIDLVKEEHLELSPENDSIKNHSYWTFVTFAYPDTDELVNTWTRPSLDSSYVTLAFVGLTSKNDLSSRKKINADYYYFENRKQIKKFEELIIEPIKQKIKAVKK